MSSLKVENIKQAAGAVSDDAPAFKSPSLKLNALSNTSSLVINILLGFYVTRMVVGYLSDLEFGIWMLTTSVVGYFGLLQLGVGTGVLRYVPMYRGKGENKLVADIICTAIAFYGALGMVIFTLCWAFSGQLASFFNGGHELAVLISIMGIAAAIECPSWVIDAAIRSFEKFALANILVNSKAVLRAVGVAVCISYDFGLLGLGYSLVAINVVIMLAGFLMLWYCRRQFRIGFGSVRPATLKMLMTFGVVVLVASAADTLTFGSGKIIIGKTVALEAVGMFGIAAMLNNYYRRTIYAVTKVFMPRFSYLQGSNSTAQIMKLYLRGSKYTTIFAALLGILLWTAGPAFIHLWLKKDYAQVTAVLAIMTASTLVLTSNRLSIDLLYGLGRQNMLAVFSIIEGVGVLILSLAFSYKLGIIGVAIGAGIPIVLMRGIVQAMYTAKLAGVSLKVYYGQRIIRLWVIASLMAGGYWGLGLGGYRPGWIGFFGVAGTIILVYLGVVYMFILEKEEKIATRSMLRSSKAALQAKSISVMGRIKKKITLMLKTVKSFLRGVLALVSKSHSVYAFVNDPELSRSYYPLAVRKSKSRMLLDNLFWLARHGEINEFYFVYGLDRASAASQRYYMAYSGFRKLRNRANSCARVANGSVDYRCLLADKFTFAKYVKSLGFATPEVLAVIDDSMVLWGEQAAPKPLSAVLEHGRLDCFIKDLTGQCAQGVHHILVEPPNIFLDNHLITIDKLRTYLKGMWILQKRMEQHPMMALLYPNSVNTIRLVTVYDKPDPMPFSALIRIGAGGNFCDNWAIGGLLGSVDLVSGTISKYCLFKPSFGTSVDRHPETRIIFENYAVPYFHDAVNTAIKLHRFFYGVHSIGWDIAMSHTGPVFIEGNDNWEISMHQALEGPLKEKFQATL